MSPTVSESSVSAPPRQAGTERKMDPCEQQRQLKRKAKEKLKQLNQQTNNSSDYDF